jgi:hypothetical protein
VLVRLDVPVAGFVNPVAWEWLTGDDTAAANFSAESRDACLTAWQQAGLIENDEPATGGQDDLLATATRITGLAVPVLAVGVAASCSYCAQLEADLAANHAALRDEQCGVVVADRIAVRCIGAVPAGAVAALADLARAAARRGTPTGVLLAPGHLPVAKSGYDQVTSALIGLAGRGRDVVMEAPTACSVNVMSGGAAVTAVTGVTAGRRLVGVGVRDDAGRELARFLAARSVPGMYVPLVLLVERPQNLFLIYRGGELIARVRTAEEVQGVLETILNGYAAAASPDEAGVPVLAGALLRDGGGVTLYPRSWQSSLVKQQSRLGRAGWRVSPDPFIMLSGSTAVIHPQPAVSPAAAWQACAAPVTEILLEPPQDAGGRGGSPAQLAAQVVNWVARPATASQVYELADTVNHVPVRTSTCEQLITEITADGRLQDGVFAGDGGRGGAGAVKPPGGRVERGARRASRDGVHSWDTPSPQRVCGLSG